MTDQIMPPSSSVRCTFCGKTPDQVNSMIQGPDGIYICDECVSLSAEAMMADLDMRGLHSDALDQVLHVTADVEDATPASIALGDLPTPRELFEQLSEHVVGQEEAKRALSVAVYNHYQRVSLGEAATSDDVELAKSNIMLLGPTGSGKTLLAQTLARTLKVPFAIADATTLTEAGYVGEDVENILLKLITAADFDIDRAEIGIIYIDEIDKVARKAENLSITRDVSGEGVQQALLKIVEGCEASVPPQGGRKHPQQELIHIDTTNILFILGGAFVGLPDIIAELLTGKLDGAFIETMVAESYATQYPELCLALEVPYDAEGSVVGVSKGNAALLEGVNRAIAAAKEDGSFDQYVVNAVDRASGEIYEGTLDAAEAPAA